jgi:hypothetical protein
MDQYLIIALIAIIFWLVGFGVYLVISSRQQEVERSLNEINDILQDSSTH